MRLAPVMTTRLPWGVWLAIAAAGTALAYTVYLAVFDPLLGLLSVPFVLPAVAPAWAWSRGRSLRRWALAGGLLLFVAGGLLLWFGGLVLSLLAVFLLLPAAFIGAPARERAARRD